MKVLISVTMIGLLAACSSMNKGPSTTSSNAVAGAPTLAWEVTEGIDTPESVYFDESSKMIFVSNVTGAPDKQDHNGYISTLDVTGKVTNKKWATGMSAPKGMRSYKGTLWVSDINRIIAIDIKTARIIRNIKINSAKFLNDVAIDDRGTVYVSDTVVNRIFTVTNGSEIGLFMQGAELESPNGLLVKGKTLYVSTWGQGMQKDWSVKVPGNLFAIDLKTKKKSNITTQPLGNLDGLEMKDGNFIVSDWMSGKVYEVSAKGESKILLEGFKNSADIGYVKEANLLIVPSMGGNTVQAYKF